MLPTWLLLPTRRRLATTAWFVAFMAFVFRSSIVPDDRGVDLGAALGWLAPMVVLGYMLAPAWQHVAARTRWSSFRERAWKTALSMAAGLAVALSLDLLVTGGVGVGNVLRGILIVGGIFLFIMTMPRIAIGRWK